MANKIVVVVVVVVVGRCRPETMSDISSSGASLKISRAPRDRKGNMSFSPVANQGAV